MDAIELTLGETCGFVDVNLGEAGMPALLGDVGPELGLGDMGPGDIGPPSDLLLPSGGGGGGAFNILRETGKHG